jgi:LacI family repressor for deo operon, udp, cdd, tsx, nupC, and nupG
MAHSPPARLKMTDVARLAGVSVATVSRALSGSPLVSRETRQRIEAAVAATGYVVNQVAAGLRLQRSRQILVMLPDIANPFFGEVVLGIEEEAQHHGFGVLIGNTGRSPDRETALARQFQTGAVDGLVLMTGKRPALLADVPASRMVAVSEHIANDSIITVSIDNQAAALEAVGHLRGLGHRRIAHIGGPADNILTAQRFRGYRDAQGDDFDQRLVRYGDYSIASGEAAMREILKEADRPTSVFCSNDEMAIGAIRAARAFGIGVPSGLAVIGFDDIPFAGAYDPPLTTVRQPRRQMGRMAARILLAALAGAEMPAPTALPHLLVVRQSS